MGGFQKFPIPKYLHIQAFCSNRNWRANTLHLFIPSVVLGYFIFRHARLTSYASIPYGQYLDPESPDAPRRLRM